MSMVGSVTRASLCWSIIASAAACGSGGSTPSIGTEPLSPNDDGGSAHVANITSGLKARATDFGEGHIHVDMVQDDGGTAFAADYKLDEQSNTLVVEHTLFTTASNGGVKKVSDSRKVPTEPGDVLTYQGAIDSTIMLHKSISGAELGLYAANNDWGCDLGPELGMQASCSNKGQCCDVHDSCYEQHGCTASSWLHPVIDSTCEYACNLPVVACMALANPGPSQCCGETLNYCGLPRLKDVPPPTTQPSASTPRFGAIPKPGTTFPKPATPNKPPTANPSVNPATPNKAATTNPSVNPATPNKPATTSRSVAQNGVADAGVGGGLATQSDNPALIDGGMGYCDPSTDENCPMEVCGEDDPDCQRQPCDPSSGEACPQDDAGNEPCDPRDPHCQTQDCDPNDPNDPDCQRQQNCDPNDPNCQSQQNCDPSDPDCQSQQNC
ncbi:MAG TPA: hypothetical protein VG963_30160, partial [Polyangiaceae bacterium]|nr:hypothetical protein [Polyangiaceae bacterium]